MRKEMKRFIRGALVIFAFFAAAAPARAQQEEWFKIDAEGRVVADLSELPITDVTCQPRGVVTVARTDVEPVKGVTQRSILRADGTLDPRTYSLILCHDDGVVKAKAGMHDEYLDQDLESITARFQAKGLQVYAYLGGERVLAGSGLDSAGVCDPEGNLLFPCPNPHGPMTTFDYGTYSEGLCAIQEKGKWGAMDTSGKLVIPPLYETRFQFRDGVAQVDRDGETFHIDRRNIRVADTALSRTRVVCVNPVADWKKRRSVLMSASGERVSKEYFQIQLDPANPERAIVRQGDSRGLIALDGREILAPDGTYAGLLHGGEGFILAQKATGTVESQGKVWNDRETREWGYIDIDGNVRIPVQYHEATPFRGGYAYVCRLITNPDLAGLPYPESFYAENVTKDRFGKVTTGVGTRSIHQPGKKYAYVISGHFKDGIPHGTCRKIVPLEGYHEGEFREGVPHGRGNFISFTEGRRYQGEYVEGVLQGHGFTRRPDSSVEFVGLFRDGQPWEGTVYFPNNDKEVLAYVDGKSAGLQPRGTYKLKLPEPKRSPRSVQCGNCNGTGTVLYASRKVEVVEHSLILAGDSNWMRGYTHYERKTGRYTYVGGGYGPCRRCDSSGRVTP